MMMHKAHVLGKVGHMLPTMAANFPEIATKVNTLFILMLLHIFESPILVVLRARGGPLKVNKEERALHSSVTRQV